ncbi:hypothetical protein F3Y22_tig00000218pilonHSYRG00138 [Hibiscus syriacus]|uniref:Reverse transcriptase domain-containing protein n=1 Tax=Hibiscus syriacus TaxID=106335 RepID=A0A6A3D620_HIBSY|nr:hypothetical protein F3Y22_tig00000218pilonHSYRG00138 [Hibiscus syriacus]
MERTKNVAAAGNQQGIIEGESNAIVSHYSEMHGDDSGDNEVQEGKGKASYTCSLQSRLSGLNKTLGDDLVLISKQMRWLCWMKIAMSMSRGHSRSFRFQNEFMNKLITTWGIQLSCECATIRQIDWFEDERDYVTVLTKGPWTIYRSYLTVQPWSRYYCKALFQRIAKVDYNTEARDHGEFARLAIMVDLNKPLRPCIGIDYFIQKIEYEGLTQICYGLERMSVENGKGDELYGPWMILQGRKRRSTPKGDSAGPDHTGGQVNGSRFGVLGWNEQGTSKDTLPERVEKEAVKNAVYLVSNPTKRLKSVETLPAITITGDVVPLHEGQAVKVANHKVDQDRGAHAAVAINEPGYDNNLATKRFGKTRSTGDRTVKDIARKDRRDSSFTARQPMPMECVIEDEGLGDNVNGTPGDASPAFGRIFRNLVRMNWVDVVALFEPRISGLGADKDLGFFGPPFIWSRGNVQQRLDRCLGCYDWISRFPVSRVMHLEQIGSDHRSLLFEIWEPRQKPLNRPFRFIAAWQDHPKFQDLLHESWSWEGSIEENVLAFKRAPRSGIWKLLVTSGKGRNGFWREFGVLTRNTKFYHAVTLSRRRTNEISVLKRGDGSLCTKSDELIENQTSFVPGRTITDNFVITQDVIHCMRRKTGKSGWMALKIDLEKVYDRLEWSIIAATLSDIGIPEKLPDLIMQCATAVSTQILWNGEQSKYFIPSREIQQGDPLSPYLFVLCIEKLA